MEIEDAKGHSIRPAVGYQFYNDESFEVGDTGVELDLATDCVLGYAVQGYINVPGSVTGVIDVQLKTETTGAIAYGDKIRLSPGDTLNLDGFGKITSIKFTWVANSAYRVLVI